MDINNVNGVNNQHPAKKEEIVKKEVKQEIKHVEARAQDALASQGKAISLGINIKQLLAMQKENKTYADRLSEKMASTEAYKEPPTAEPLLTSEPLTPTPTEIDK